MRRSTLAHAYAPVEPHAQGAIPGPDPRLSPNTGPLVALESPPTPPSAAPVPVAQPDPVVEALLGPAEAATQPSVGAATPGLAGPGDQAAVLEDVTVPPASAQVTATPPSESVPASVAPTPTPQSTPAPESEGPTTPASAAPALEGAPATPATGTDPSPAVTTAPPMAADPASVGVASERTPEARHPDTPSGATAASSADRMERIRVQTAAIRQAIEDEAHRAAALGSEGAVGTAATVAQESPTASVYPMPRRARTSGVFGPDSDLEQEFLGDDLGDDEDDGDLQGSGFGFAPAPRPLPWKPILIAAGVLAAAAGWWFRGELFPASPAAATTPGDTEAPPASEPEPAPAHPPEAVGAALVAGRSVAPTPIDPEADQPSNPVAGGQPSIAAEPPAPAAPDTPLAPAAAPMAPAPDPALAAQLDEARNLYGSGQSKALAQAQSLLDDILARHPNQADALMLRAQVLLDQGQTQPALDSAQACIQVAPGLADCWLTIGVVEQDRKHHAEAAEAYERYLALAPDGRYAGDVRKQLVRIQK